MADRRFRIMKHDFVKGSECLGIFNEERSGPAHKTARYMANREKHDVTVERPCANGWREDELEGDFGVFYYTPAAEEAHVPA